MRHAGALLTRSPALAFAFLRRRALRRRTRTRSCGTSCTASSPALSSSRCVLTLAATQAATLAEKGEAGALQRQGAGQKDAVAAAERSLPPPLPSPSLSTDPLQVAFGKGETAWNNIAPTDLIRRHSKEIERFGRTLKRIKKAEWFYAFIPIRRLLSLFRFSKSFRDHLVFPLTALFFGTGNQVRACAWGAAQSPPGQWRRRTVCAPCQPRRARSRPSTPPALTRRCFSCQTPHVSSVVVERVFLDPDVRLFDYDPEYLLSQQPDFNAFTNLDEIYTTIADKMPATVHLGNGITKVERHALRGFGCPP